MANGARIVEGMRKTSLTNQEIDLFKQSFVLVPYQPSGYLDISNRGFNSSITDVNSFETFKRVWTGNDAFNIQWKNSIVCTQNPETLKGEIEFKLGEVILGLMETNNSDGEITQDESFSQYKAQQAKNTMTFRISRYFNIDDNYQFLFWKIPEISGSTLYRISSLEKDYVGTQLVGYVMTLESLNQELANTGRARQQNVMPNSPGQGYLECIVKDSTWPSTMTPEGWAELIEGKDYYVFFDRYITADFQKQMNRPCRYVNVKFFGNAIPSTISFVGRPTLSRLDYKAFGTPCMIFPINFRNPDTPNLFNTQSNETNCYFGSFSPTVQFWKEWKDNAKDFLLNTNNQWSYNGFLQYSKSELDKTNPLDDDGRYKYDIFGYTQKTTEEVKVIPWTFTTPVANVKTGSVEGCSESYTIGGEKALHDHMFDNYWTQKDMKTLPINTKSSFNFGNSVPSLNFGNWVSTIANSLLLGLIGVSYVYNTIINRLNFRTFRGLVSAPFLDLNDEQWKITASTGDKIEMSILNGDTSSPTSIFFSTQTMSIGLHGELTDAFYDSRYSGVLFHTENIGQSTFADGEYINTNKEPYLLNGKTNLVSTPYGFIIDKINICALFKGELSIEFLDEDKQVIWTGIYQSEGKWTDSIKEIWTEKITSSFGRENIFFNEPLPYPKPLPPLVGELPLLPPINKVFTLCDQYYRSTTSGSEQVFFYNLLNSGEVALISNVGPSYGKVCASSTSLVGGEYPYENAIKLKVMDYTQHVPNYEKFKLYYSQNIQCFMTYNVSWWGMSARQQRPTVWIGEVNDANHQRVGETANMKIPDELNVYGELQSTSDTGDYGRPIIPRLGGYDCGGYSVGDPRIRKFSVMMVEEDNALYAIVNFYYERGVPTANFTSSNNPQFNDMNFCGITSFNYDIVREPRYIIFRNNGGFSVKVTFTVNLYPTLP